jgi:hypothetical protein
MGRKRPTPIRLPKTVWRDFNQLENQRTFYPRSISFEDIDRAVFDWFNSRQISINGEIVPAIFLIPEKWAEIKKSWNRMNADHNVKFPYITVKRSNAPKLAENPFKSRIPGKLFTTYKVPIYTDSGPTYKFYKVPQPIKVDMEYEIRALTLFHEDINLINETLLRHFASLQAYLSIDNHFMPMTIESVSDESVDSTEDERVLHTLYSIMVKGYIIDENEFEEKIGVANLTIKIEEETK